MSSSRTISGFEIAPRTVSSDLIGPFNTDFPAHCATPLPQLAVTRTQFDLLYTPEN